ncbi:MAG: SMI1/KNR4 family protein [Planctomycetota bacterium]
MGKDAALDYTRILESVADLGVPSASSDALRWAESELGVTLPQSYKNLVRHRNGGRFFFTGILSKEQPFKWHTHRRVYEVESYAGVHRDAHESITEYTTLAKEEWNGPEGLVAFAGDGHWWLCLDYRDLIPGAEPPVVHSENGSESEDGECHDFVVADSFADLLQGLCFDSGGDYLLSFRDLDRDEITKKLMRLHAHPDPNAHEDLRVLIFDNFRGSMFDRASITVGEGIGHAPHHVIEQERLFLGVTRSEIVLPVSVHSSDARNLMEFLFEKIGSSVRVVHSPIDGPQL